METYVAVFLDVLLSTLERNLANLLAVGLLSDSLGSALGLHLLDGATLLEDRLWDKTIQIRKRRHTVRTGCTVNIGSEARRTRVTGKLSLSLSRWKKKEPSQAT